MIIRKWNDTTQEYEKHFVPDDWKLILYSDDMNTPINCVNCGKEMTFGDGYTSRRYHTDKGFGYYECEECYFNYMAETL